MNIDGRDFLTCAEKKCDVKYCDHRIGCNCDELGCIVWLPGLDCPKAEEKAVKEAMDEQKAEMQIKAGIKVDDETANRCLRLLEWYFDDNPSRSLGAERSNADGKVKLTIVYE